MTEGGSGVARSGETFNSVAFGRISLHFVAFPTLTLTLSWIPAFAGMTGVDNVAISGAMA